MVSITNGVNTFVVTRGAYKSIFSKQGYVLSKVQDKNYQSEQKKDNSTVPTPGKSGKSDDELFLESIEEKPISQWNKEEVKRFATLNDLDISGTKNVGEAKEIIKKFMEENQ